MNLIERVVSRWTRVASECGRIPGWVISRYQSRVSLQSSPQVDEAIFHTAKESINALMPNFLAFLKKKLGDRYRMNASQRRTDIYYFFAPPQPVDSLAMHLGVKGAQVHLDLSYSPNDLQGNRAPERMIEKREVIDDPELAGLRMMSMLRKILPN